jgi:hypothetical protein
VRLLHSGQRSHYYSTQESHKKLHITKKQEHNLEAKQTKWFVQQI